MHNYSYAYTELLINFSSWLIDFTFEKQIIYRFISIQLTYHIMQFVYGGKVSRLHDLLVIRGKTFAIVRQYETPYNRKKKIAGKPLRLEANPQKLQKFSTANDLHYTVCDLEKSDLKWSGYAGWPNQIATLICVHTSICINRVWFLLNDLCSTFHCQSNEWSLKTILYKMIWK